MPRVVFHSGEVFTTDDSEALRIAVESALNGTAASVWDGEGPLWAVEVDTKDDSAVDYPAIVHLYRSNERTESDKT